MARSLMAGLCRKEKDVADTKNYIYEMGFVKL